MNIKMVAKQSKIYALMYNKKRCYENSNEADIGKVVAVVYNFIDKRPSLFVFERG